MTPTDPPEATTPGTQTETVVPAFTDTHVHFWDRREPALTYSWLEPDVKHPVAGDYEAIKATRYLPDDFVAETRFSNLTKVVHVQAAVGTADPLMETRWIEHHREGFPLPLSLVASADLADGAARSTLEAQLEAGPVSGVRDLRYDDYFANAQWRRGYAGLSEYGLAFCDDPQLEQMADAARLAESCPETIYCVDHAGVPAQRSPDYFRTWRKHMKQLANVENTIVKISGLGMGDHRWTVDTLRDWALTCVELWGVSRVVLGSNWPCDRMYSSYGDVWRGYSDVFNGLSADEREMVFAKNANRIFRLEG